MIEGRLSRRYGKALFELALEQQREDAVGQEIERFFAVYTNSPLQTVLNNPAFDLNSRKAVLLEITKNLQLSPLSINFLSILLERDRLTYLSAIVSYYRGLLNAAKGRVEAKITDAAPLAPALMERLRDTLHAISGKEVVLAEETESGLLGGIMVELQGTIYDGSVRTQLEKMKQRIAREY
jgi:F-type H+-transporting ATPase subunit delta